MRILLGIVVALTACVAPSDENDTRGGLHSLTVTWTIKNADGSTGSCPAGFQDILVSITNAEQGAQEQQLVPCAGTGSHVASIYTSGDLYFMMPDDNNTYVWHYSENQQVILYITDPTGANVRTKSIMVPVKLDADKAVSVDLYPDAGFAIVKWELRSGITDSFVFSCAAVALDAIEVRYRPFDDEQAPLVTDRWPCDSHDKDFPYLGTYDVGSGRTRALPVASYVGTMYGLRGGQVVAMAEGVNIPIKTRGDVSETAGGSLVVADR